MSNTYNLADKTALVTGSTKGIGLEVARLFAQNGAKVLVHGSNASRCEQTARTIDGATPVAWDLSDPAGAEIFCHQVSSACDGRLDILVHNAGFSPMKTIDEQSLAEWNRVQQINVTAAFDMTKRLLPCLRAGEGASIVFISSVVVLALPGDSAAYTASKAAQIGLARQLAAELGPAGIRVNTVRPGLVDTPGARQVNDPKDFETFPKTKQMVEVAIQPEDIAHAVAFLASPAARAITAACIDVNGGMAVGG